jgi:hypothetical protein
VIDTYSFVTYFTVSMKLFKRNQIEEGISRAINGRPLAAPTLRIKIKRLLDLDRAKQPKSAGVAKFAFYTSEKPGKGTESYFSEYEAYALLMGVRLLDHGLPQGFVVAILRSARSKLEKCHSEILRMDPKKLFVSKRAQVQHPGDLFVSNERPAYLLIVSDQKIDESHTDEPYPRVFLNHFDAFQFQLEKSGRSCSWFELVSPAWVLRQNLEHSKPRPRGRSS